MKKKLVIFLSLFVIIFLTFNSVSATTIQSYNEHSSNSLSVDQIESCNRIDSLTSEYSNAYQVDESTISYIIESQKINFRSDNWAWEKVNDEIIKMDIIDSNYQFENKANDFKVSFGLDDEKILTKISKNKYSIEFSLPANNNTSLEISNSVEECKNDYLINLNRNLNTIIYKNIFENSDLAYTVSGDTLKEDIILYSRPSFNEITYNIQVNNLEFKKTTTVTDEKNNDTGEWSSTSGIGVFYDLTTFDEVFRITNIFIVDANGKYSSPLRWDYRNTEEGYSLNVLLDNEFLGDPLTKYPVVLDPTVQGASVTFDTYTSSLNQSTNYYLNAYLRTGCDTTYGNRHTYIKWTFPQIDVQHPIDTAYIDLKRYSSAGSITLRAKRILSSWTSSSVTWLNSPSCDSTVIYGDGLVDDWYKIDLTYIAKRWRYGIFPNYGVKIYNSVENNSNIWATFCSSDNSTAIYKPKLVINVNTTDDYYIIGPHYISNSVALDLDGLTEYTVEFNTAMLRWNSSGANCYFYQNNYTGNKVFIDDTYPYPAGVGAGTSPYSIFEMYFNTNKIDIECDTWDTTPIPYCLHELGHTIGPHDMGDYEPDHNFCVMGHGGENAINYPTVSDIAGVNSVW